MSEAEAFDLRPGDTFAQRYVVERALKQGGMGAVYVVKHHATGKRMALKVMLPEVVKRPEHRERFERESRVGAVIDDSSHIVEVLDAGIDGETPYLVMEFLVGKELAEVLVQRGALPPDEAVDILKQLALALEAAHAKGVVHRDLKPENLFLVDRPGKLPVLKVLDFGIAKIVEGTRDKGSFVGGSALYMAPEQARRAAMIGPFTDIWAFGLIAFRMLVGRPYWLGKDLAALVKELTERTLAPATARAASFGVALPPDFDAFFGRTVAPKPEHRTSSVMEALTLLCDAYGLNPNPWERSAAVRSPGQSGSALRAAAPVAPAPPFAPAPAPPFAPPPLAGVDRTLPHEEPLRPASPGHEAGVVVVPQPPRKATLLAGPAMEALVAPPPRFDPPEGSVTTGEAPQGRRGAELAANAGLAADGGSPRQGRRPQAEGKPTVKADEIVAPKRAARKPVEVRVEEAPRLGGDAAGPKTRRRSPIRDGRPAKREERRAPNGPNIPEPPPPAPARDSSNTLTLLVITMVTLLLLAFVALR